MIVLLRYKFSDCRPVNELNDCRPKLSSLLLTDLSHLLLKMFPTLRVEMKSLRLTQDRRAQIPRSVESRYSTQSCHMLLFKLSMRDVLEHVERAESCCSNRDRIALIKTVSISSASLTLSIMLTKSTG